MNYDFLKKLKFWHKKPVFNSWETGTLLKLVEENLADSKEYFEDFVGNSKNEKRVAALDKQYSDLIKKIQGLTRLD